MKRILVVLTLTLVFIGCNETPNQPELKREVIINEVNQGDFAHSVYIWLKNPDSDEDRQAFMTSLRKFVDHSPYIQTTHIGKPADTNRDVIDNTYTYSLLLTFKDKAEQDKYQDEPAHKLFIEESSNLWSKVLVYDSENLLKN